MISSGDFIQCGYDIPIENISVSTRDTIIIDTIVTHITTYSAGNLFWTQSWYNDWNGNLWQDYNVTVTLGCPCWEATLPEGDSLLVRFGTDVFLVGGRGDPIYGQNDVVWHGWDDYFGGGGGGAWSSFIVKIGDPQPGPDVQPPPGEVRFDKYLAYNALGQLIDGRNWLPDPTTRDSLIGLAFSCTTAAGAAGSRIVYEIFEVTTWRGVNMNDPRNAKYPTPAIGEFYLHDSTDFDFQVYNPIIQGRRKYKITTHNRDIYDPYARTKEGDLGSLVSERRYTVERDSLVRLDTLWLIAKDYAAHCIVTPRGLSTYVLRLRGWSNPIDTTAKLRCVTVPRDYDGWQDVGINRGDQLADRWEETSLNVAENDSAIVTFYPFYNKDTQGAFTTELPADRDSLPAGRGIRGDRLSSWEEYRGFTMTGNVDTVYYSNPNWRHRRLNPLRKSVLNSWDAEDTLLHKDVRKNIPGWLSYLNDSLQIYFVGKYFVLGPRNNSIARNVNRNRQGAYFSYFSVPGISNEPADFEQNTITWWNPTRAEIEYCRLNRIYGFTRPDSLMYTRYGFAVPEYHKNSCVLTSVIEDWRRSTYYNNNPGQWSADFNRMIKFIISHEFGHCVAMEHLNNVTIMQRYTPIYTIQGPNYGRFFYPSFSQQYSPTSYGQITIKPE